MHSLLRHSAAIALTIATAFTSLAQEKAAKKPEAKKAEAKSTITKWDSMDLGPFFSGYMMDQSPESKPQSGKHLALKGITLKLGAPNEGAMCFDTELLRMSYGWTGGFIKLPWKREGLEGFSEVRGEKIFETSTLPGWAKNGSFTDPRPKYTPSSPAPYGHLPNDWAKWRGLYLSGDKTVLAYTVGGVNVLELPGVEKLDGKTVLTRTIKIDATPVANTLLVCDEPNGTAKVENGLATLTAGDKVITVALAGKGASLKADNGRVLVQLPADKSERQFKLTIARSAVADAGAFASLGKAAFKPVNFAAPTKGGPTRWNGTVETKGKLATGKGPYVVDTITVPDDNPWKSWLRCSAFDFFKDGRAAVCTVSGDVWIVSGIDARLEKVSWKRYATGLFQPLGLKIVDEKIYVLGRDQITRLHDLNKDGEADFYECFNNDVVIGPFYHEFALNLETDSKGNFYFIKGGNLGEATHPHHGCLLRVSKDGSKLDVIATGHRAPNGLSISPRDEITTSDNEGNWVPTSRVNWIKPGGFYGHVSTAHLEQTPTSYDKPLFWLPHQMDNSSGGETWVTSDKWGPFKGDMLHTSYGKCDLFKVMYESVDGQMQGGAIKFPLNFDSGIMRARFSPIDGQLYVTGLRVWQSSGAREGTFQRVRYTGEPVNMAKELHVKKDGVEITFTQPLDADSAKDLQNYSVDEWNYKWTKEYGSKLYSVHDPEKALGDKGQAVYRGEEVEIKSVTLSADKKTVFLKLAEVIPVMQMRVRYNIDAADGTNLRQEVYNTINVVPSK